MLRIHFSNRVESLLEKMKKTLFSKESTPFTKRFVIVPSPAMKSWIMLQLAKDQRFGISAGLHFSYLESAVNELKQLLCSSAGNTKKPSLLEVSLKIETIIRQVIEEESYENEIWQPLFAYLKAQNSKLSRKSERRLTSLSSKLAILFDRYENYGYRMLDKWRTGKNGGWQAEIWRKLCIEKVEDQPLQRKNLQIDLFSISFLPKKHHEFLKKIAEDHSVNYYVLSPCQAFWTDILTDRESRRLKKYWESKGGSEPQLHALEELLFDRNALLANFGRMGREMALLLENEETNEEYQVTSNIAGYSQYQEFLFENININDKGSSQLTLLEGIQADLLFLRNPEIQEKVDLAMDNSIQVHIANSKMREVQVLYDALAGIMDRHSRESEPICPGDIIVMAPDISDYEPYIRSVFEDKIDFQIMDLNLLTQNPLVRCFLHLLTLPLTRWDVSSILQLLECGSFRKKQGMTLEDAGKIKSWVKEAGIRWGGDKVHREELLKQNHCLKGMVDDTAIGTWEHGLERLLYGWMMQTTENDEIDAKMEVIPVDYIELTQGELLGRWIFLFQSLRRDLKFLIDGTKMTTQEWAKALKKLLESYFMSEDSEEEENKNHLLQTLSSFEKISDNESKYTFITIRHHLISALNTQRVCYREPHLQAIRFCSMLPMRALPAKVIVLLGMEEGAFPRKDQTHSLNCMVKEEGIDYSPSQTDFDRYLFLEILLSARKYLLITYCGYSKTDSKERPASLLISELINYLDAGFTLDGLKPSEKCIIKHPFREYDKRYFDGSFLSYSQENYLAAQAFYHGEKKDSHCFISEFGNLSEQSLANEITLDLKNLVKMARNSVAAYYNNTLGIYLEKDEDLKVKTEESFVLSNLEKGKLKKLSLKSPFSHVIEVAHKKGELPLGPFRNIAVEAIEEDVLEVKKRLQQAGIQTEKLFEIEFSESTGQVTRENGILKLPPLDINYKGITPIRIIGKLDHVVPEGLFAYVGDEKGDALKVWPEYLVYLCLCEKYSLDLGKKLILAKSGTLKEPYFQNAHALLEQFIEYYLGAVGNVSPLIPEWVSDIIKLDKEAFEKKTKTQLSERSTHFYNDYMRKMMEGSEFKLNQQQFDHWKSVATKLYGDMYENWY